jgi:peptidoglycan/LPS O-acetylase OafA/YrhL
MTSTDAAKGAAPGKAARDLPERFHWLDFLRFLAALAVVLFHYRLLYFDGTESIVPENTVNALAPHPAIAFFYDWGQFAVPLFWVLSGFVFAHVYFRKPADGYSFAAARFARLYPLHFATLIAVAGLQILSVRLTGSDQVVDSNDLRHFAMQIFLVSGWGFEDGLSFNMPIWSVSAEIAAYIIFCMLHRDRWFRTAAGQATCLTVAMTIAAAFPSFGAITTCCAFFFAGSLTYLLVARRRPTDFLIAGALTLAGWIALPDTLMWRLPIVACIAGFSGVIFVVAWMDILRVRGGRLAGATGDMTYSIYLIHTPLIIAALVVLNAAGIEERAFVSSPLTLGVYIAAILAISAVCYRRFERPADRRLRGWARRRRQAALPEAQAA